MKREYDTYRVCPKCKSTDVILDIKAHEDSTISEVEVHCKACETIHYWAYGFYENNLEEDKCLLL